jgi:hypothetical protein
MRTMFQIIQQFNLIKLIEFARSVFNDQNEQNNFFKMSSVESHLLNLTQIDVSDNYYHFVEIISYKA